MRCSPALVVQTCLLLLAAGGAATAASDVLRVMPLVREGRVFVSFELADGFTPEIRGAIHSGLPTTFTYDVELRRSVPFWLDRTLASATIAATVKFDNLTRRHQLGRTLDGRMEESRVTEDEEDVRRWMTRFERVSLFRTTDLEANVEYYVRVQARTHPRDAWFFWPWDRGAAAANARFTFIP
jgi:hypothetical protein